MSSIDFSKLDFKHVVTRKNLQQMVYFKVHPIGSDRRVGNVLCLPDDDGTDTPYFKIVNGPSKGRMVCEHLSDLRGVTQGEIEAASNKATAAPSVSTRTTWMLVGESHVNSRPHKHYFSLREALRVAEKWVQDYPEKGRLFVAQVVGTVENQPAAVVKMYK